MGKSLFNLNLKSIFVYTFFLIPHLALSSNEEILSTLDKLHLTIKDISEKRIDQKNIKYISHIISETYDLKKMSKIILGKHWDQSKPDERRKFINKFSSFIASTYLKKFMEIQKFNYEYKGFDNLGKNYRIVHVIFKFNETEELRINYILINHQKSWLIFDTLLDGSISEIAIKKSEFNETLQKGGINSLIKKISE